MGPGTAATTATAGPGLIADPFCKNGSRLPELEGLILGEAFNQPLSFYEMFAAIRGKA